ncbi:MULTISPECIES: HD domain-containing protein [unclassified Oceanispirochaeta]|uniref:HD domain-containing protein n=1 Tax=unclassified Oceanispirochaeta TaxID=2635722 RepID=UPI000E09AF6E|nr:MULTISPECIES: HD domain-containing protein [unclassified Oceanispirochaeta]MBF9016931.1 HD domain-containing protein [Oceanispirochaeta sp. M2]NPD73294.1 HD domain-containing protein [Oceanispirochaeta sp. M1]RDG30958.1 HD domain-containing protein [Oceanispirochaeta sp. M1]
MIPDESPEELESFLPDESWKKLINLALPYQDKRDDAGHFKTVTTWAWALLELGNDEIDRELVLTAALLHDIGWSQLSEEERTNLFSSDLSFSEAGRLRLAHEKMGAELAIRLLTKAGYSAEFTQKVCLLIEGHDTRLEFMSPEDGILRDADSLWMVTNTGFEADLRRRKVSAAVWGRYLENKFQKENAFYTTAARNWAVQRLSRLKKGYNVHEAGREKKPKVLICHYRVGWTDGVSLEIEKRQSILEEMGFTCSLLAGPGSSGADYTIPDLDFDTPEARKISRNAFGGLKDYETEEELKKDLLVLSDKIEEELSSVFEELEPDFVLLHNIFSHGRHIAAARAFYNCLKHYKVPSLATHHDFYWERDDFREVSGPLIKAFMKRYVPPVIPGMKHAVINSLAARNLLNRCGIDAMIFPDTLDFSVDQWQKDDYNAHLLKDFNLNEDDIFILQATRIVRRKGIELIPPLIKELNKTLYLDQIRGKTLYNGKRAGKDCRFVFLLAGYAEQEAEGYRQQLEGMMKEMDTPYRFMRSRIAVQRTMEEEKRIYSLFDTYPYADLVSYPSIYEGWGNQFIEAVFAHKPVIVHEYPVFRSDIRPKGYSIISLGDDARRQENGLYKLKKESISSACQEIIDRLLSGDTEKILEKNFDLARSNNSYDYLRALMRQSMEHYENL